MYNIFQLLVILTFLSGCSNKQTGKEMEIRQKIIAEELVSKNINLVEIDTVTSKFKQELEDQGLVSIHSLDPSIRIELKYATTDNFTKEVLYDELNEGYLHPIAAEKLVKAQQLLKNINDSLCLLVYDAVRPLSVQRKMYQVVQNTPYQSYVANPDRTGLHNYGIAVDLTICNNRGEALDMGTPFDYFGREAGINNEEKLIEEGRLNRKQVNNRKLLRKVMTDAGFLTISGEWWHFNALSLAEAKRKTKLIE